MRRFGRFSAPVIGTMLAVVCLTANAALAHDPVFLTEDQVSPETGPYFPDGAISWAIYGSFAEASETRGFEFDLREGEELYISLLIPNLEPELSLSVDELPRMDVVLPDGSVLTVEPTIGEVFDEPFSGTSYVELHESRQPAQAGRHQVTVFSEAPSRFSVAFGEREEFGTPAERTVDRPSGFAAFAEPLNAWWATPPGADGPIEGESVEMDVEAAEAAVERLEVERLEEEQDADATSAESAATEPASDGGGSGPQWVIPALVLLVAIVGGGWMLRSRRAA